MPSPRRRAKAWIPFNRSARELDSKSRGRSGKRRLMIEMLESRRVLASFEVTSLEDTTDAADNVVTLREAIESANSQPGADEITFAASLFNNAPQTITLTQGELTINEELTITGPGQSLLTIDADEMSRVINVSRFEFDPNDPTKLIEASIDVTLDGVTITGGKTIADNPPVDPNVPIEERSFENGGGIRFGSTGTLTLRLSTITGNSTEGLEAKGGGIATNTGNIVLDRSTVSNNSTAGLYGFGGGVFANEGSITLVSSNVIDNKTTGDLADGGGISSGIANIKITSSLIASNKTEGNGAFGAGMLVLEGSATIINSTISGNQVTGTTSDGGGIWTDDASITLVNSTITANSATLAGGGLAIFETAADGKLILHNTIIAGNTAPFDPDFNTPNNPSTNLEVRSSLIGNNESTTLAAGNPDSNGNLVGTPTNPLVPGLEPLADNGGPTKTHSLLLGSPAIDKGDNGLAKDSSNAALESDQRGAPFDRLVGTIVDIGAFEFRETLEVNTRDDAVLLSDGVLGLREAILIANATPGADTITFASSTDGDEFSPFNLHFGLGQLQITDSVTITGNGATKTIVNALEQGFRVIDVTSATPLNVNISGVTITGGQAGTANGGGINFNNSGSLTLTNSTLSGNTANFGGGLYNRGTATLTNSTLSGNTATQRGGGLYNRGTATLTNSTLSGNTTTQRGGGLYNRGTATLTNSTLSGNTASLGGGLFNYSTRTAVLNNSIVAGNTATSGNDPTADVSGTVAGSSNLIGDPASAGGLGHGTNGNIVGQENTAGQRVLLDINTVLAPLAFNGGPTQTHALVQGSPAINAGNNEFVAAGVTTDQRGLPFARILGGTVDIGAFEFRDKLEVNTTTDEVDFMNNNLSLREAMQIANATPGADTITFADSADGTIGLANDLGQLQITDSVTITGNGATRTVINALEQGFRVINVTAATALDVIIGGVTITGGQAGSANGGGISFDNSGTLTLTNSTLSGNTANRGGGLFNTGTATLTNSTLSGNSTTGGGGGLFNTGTATLTNSTLSGNSTTESSGGGLFNTGTATLTNSTLSENTATQGTGGGGLFNRGTATLTNSTLSGNTAGSGGGLFNTGTATLTLTNSTLSGNTATIDGGGGLANQGTATLYNSIVAGNTASFAGADVFNTTSVTGSFNLIGDPAAAGGLVHGTNGNIVGQENSAGQRVLLDINTVLAPLAFNGGPTQTHALLPGSPALDRGDESLLRDGTLVDQRGVARVIDLSNVTNATDKAGLDIGAVEMIGVSIANNIAIEDAGSIEFSITLSHALPAGQTVDVILMTRNFTGGAVAGVDYAEILAEFVQFTSDDPLTKTFVVPIDEDMIDEVNETFEVVLSSATGAMISEGIATATIVDNDTRGITISPIIGNVTEAGGIATFTVVLTSEPTADVTIPLSSSDATEGTVGTESLTFTPANWNVAQTVTVTGVNDDVDDGDVAFDVVIGPATGGDYAGEDAGDLSVTNTDDDIRGITVSAISGNVTEAGGSATFTVVLTSQPTANVTIPLSSGDATEGTVGPESLTFTPANWNVPQTVTVTGANDDVDDGDIAFDVVIGAATGGDYAGEDAGDVSVTNTDNDIRGITVSAISGNVTEAGGSATFTVVLTSQPTANVTIPLSSGDATEGTVGTESLTFTPANWNVAQTVTVTGVNDDVDDGDIAFNVVIGAATGGDYAGEDAGDLSVTNTDNDTRGITVSSISGNVTEASGAATFTVVLTSQPTSDITIPLSSSDTTEGTVAPTSLTFTPTNWNVAQTVTVTGVNDDVDDGDVAFNVVIGAATGGNYEGLNPSDVSVTNVDNETRGITVSAISGNVTEAGGAATFTVVLTSQPTANVTIPLSSSDTSEGSVGPATLTFTPTNWNVAQTVTVTGVNDNVDDGDIAFNIVTGAATGGDYGGIDADDLAVTNQDDDEPLDFGDAPSRYPVTLVQNGARHTTGTLFLGTGVDVEADGQPSVNVDAYIDEGVSLIASLYKVDGAASRSSFRVVASQAAKLDGWIDFNADGDWDDAGEQIFTGVDVVAGANILTFSVPASAAVGDTAARFRLSTAGALAPTGAASDGEVEDYLHTVIDGDSNAGVTVTIVNGTIRLTLDNNENVVRSGATELFRALASSINALQVNGTASDDTITIDMASGFTVPTAGIDIDGGEGTNTLMVEGAGNLDLTDPNSSFESLSTIVLPSDSFNRLTLDRNAVNSLSPTTKTLRVTSGLGDVIEVESPNEWRLGAPRMEGGKFVLTARHQQTGGETIEVDGGRAFRNFLQVGDVDNSGIVTAGDALAVIFELNQRSFSAANGDLADPASIANWPGIYYDANGDGRATAADALNVLNILFLQSLAGGEGESSQQPSINQLGLSSAPSSTTSSDDVPSVIPQVLVEPTKPLRPTSSTPTQNPNIVLIDDIMRDWESDDEDNGYGLKSAIEETV